MTQISIKTKSYARNENYRAIVDALNDEGYQITGQHVYSGGVSIITNAPRNFVERIEFNRSAVQIRG
jgi:tRNA G26 N,N-dimethylase Trm1